MLGRARAALGLPPVARPASTAPGEHAGAPIGGESPTSGAPPASSLSSSWSSSATLAASAAPAVAWPAPRPAVSRAPPPLNEIQVLEGHRGPVQLLCAIDASRFASGGLDGAVIVWHVATGQRLATLVHNNGSGPAPVLSMLLLDTGLLACGLGDHTIALWNTYTWQCVEVLRAHRHGVHSLRRLSRNRFLSASHDSNMWVWQLAPKSATPPTPMPTPMPTPTPTTTPPPPPATATTPASSLAATCAEDEHVQVKQRSRPASVASSAGSPAVSTGNVAARSSVDASSSSSFVPAAPAAAAFAPTPVVPAAPFASPRSLVTKIGSITRLDPGELNEVLYLPGGGAVDKVATAGASSEIIVYEVDGFSFLRALNSVHDDHVLSLCAVGERRFASGSADGAIVLWDSVALVPLFALARPEFYRALVPLTPAVVVHPALVAHHDDAAAGAPLPVHASDDTVTPPQRGVALPQHSPASTASSSATPGTTPTASGTLQASNSGSASAAHSASSSTSSSAAPLPLPPAALLAATAPVAGSQQHQQQHQQHHQHHHHHPPAVNLLHALSGQLLAAAVGSAVRVFDCSTGECVMQWHAHDSAIHGLQSLYGGHCLLTCGEDGLLKLWSTSRPLDARVAASGSGNSLARPGARSAVVSPPPSLDHVHSEAKPKVPEKLAPLGFLSQLGKSMSSSVIGSSSGHSGSGIMASNSGSGIVASGSGSGSHIGVGAAPGPSPPSTFRSEQGEVIAPVSRSRSTTSESGSAIRTHLRVDSAYHSTGSGHETTPSEPSLSDSPQLPAALHAPVPHHQVPAQQPLSTAAPPADGPLFSAVCVGVLDVHEDAPVHCVLRLDDRSLASCSSDGLVVLWKDGRGQEVWRNSIAALALHHELSSLDADDTA